MAIFVIITAIAPNEDLVYGREKIERTRIRMNRIGRILLISAAVGLAATGCGSRETDKSYTEKGMECIDTLKYDEAMEEFDKAEKAGESLELIYRGEGIAWLGRCEYEKAAEAFQMALEQSDGRIGTEEKDVSYYLAFAEFKGGDMEGAVDTYTDLLAFDKKDKNAYYLRGSAYLAQDEKKKAQADFKKAVELGDGDYDLYILIYRNFLEKGYEEEGIAYLNEALEAEGKKAIDYYGRGRAWYYLGNNEKAIEELGQAVEAGNTEALIYTGMAWEKLEDREAALESYEKYLENNSKSGEVYNRIGLCRMEEGDFKGALESFQAGIETGDTEGMEELLFNEIAAYEYLGDFAAARDRMASFVEKYPENGLAARENEFLMTR